MKSLPIAPWKVIPGTGQSLSLSGTTAGAFANAVGKQTYAVWLSIAPTATPTGAEVTITNAATGASTSTDIFLKTTDPGLIIGCAPGDTVAAKALATCVMYLTELTH